MPIPTAFLAPEKQQPRAPWGPWGVPKMEAPPVTLWLCQQFAIANGPVEIADFFPSKIVDLSSSLC